ncbi:MAG: orotidine-5'-phosphate decarboxylase, partial [Bacteroidota bacterium]
MTRKELINHIHTRKSFLCIGLDPELGKIPECLRKDPDALFVFCREIVDATRDLCVAYKPNTAFFEQYGSKGWDSLERLVGHIGNNHFIIADAKRGDIGNTSTMYAKAFFESLGADAVTLSPYMGYDSLHPFMVFNGKWAVVLALTSNAGSGDFQLRKLEQEEIPVQLFEHVLTTVSGWGTPE